MKFHLNLRGAMFLVVLVYAQFGHAYELQRQKIFETYSYNKEPAIKVAFFDADSTLRVAPSGTVTAASKWDVVILPNVEHAIADLNQMGYFIAIVSNQGGVATGQNSLEQADQALLYAIAQIRRKNEIARIHYFDFADGLPDNLVFENEEVRKPGIGMALRLEQNLRKQFGSNVFIDRENSFMVGDSAFKTKDGKPWHFSDSDRGFAQNFFRERFSDGEDFFSKEGKKGTFYEPQNFFRWNKIALKNKNGAPVFDGSTLGVLWNVLSTYATKPTTVAKNK